MANVLESLSKLIDTSIAGDPPPPDILLGIQGRLGELMALSVDPSGDGISRWLARLHDITHDTRLHETLIVRVLQMKFTRAAEFLTLLGIIKFEWAPGDPVKPVAFSIDWAKFNSLITDPGQEALTLLLSKVQAIDDIKALQVLLLMLVSSPQALLELEYRQQGFMGMPVSQVPGINSQELLDMIGDLVNSPAVFPLPIELDPPLTIEQFITKATPPVAEGDLGSITISGPADDNDFKKLDDLEVSIHLLNAAGLKAIDIGDKWQLAFTSSAGGGQTFKLHFTEDGIDTAFASTAQLGFALSKIPGDGDPGGSNALLVGAADGTHFSIKTIGIGLLLNNQVPVFTITAKFGNIEFALKPDFLKFLSFGLNIPAQLKFQTDIELSYVQGKGLTGQGAAGGLPALGIEFSTPINLKIGGSGAGVNVDQVTTRVEAKFTGSDFLFRALFRYGATARFGPLKAVMDGAGVWIGRWDNGNGGLLPPLGIGASLDAGPVSGGGFLKVLGDNEFAGALQLKILGIGAFAYCVYKTLPSGDVSFVALIGIRLPMPGIQISFGFAVSGFGGLVGINRKADTDLIRERLASGGAGDVLFNDDPMRNAPKLLGDMRLFFPDKKSSFIIGPTLQINWLFIIKLDVGIFIELPGPKIFMAGSAKLVIGSEEFALVYLRMDFVGGLDGTKSLIFFDAALVNSHVLGIFRITGGVALRIAYGDNGYFLFSVGGFHPSFNPGSMELPKVPRVGVSYSLGPVWLKKEMYLAITSNTFQLGSRIEAGLEIGPISAHGWFGFDALIQFKPFHFIGQIDAGFDVEVAGISLCSVHIEGLLSGPGPLVIQARASVKILFVRISGDITIELSSNPPEFINPIPNIPKHLEAELSKLENLRFEGEDKSVVFAPQDEKGKFFAPIGEIIWEQKRIPLNLDIEKVEGVELGSWHHLEAKTDTLVSTAEQDWFGVGTFMKMADGEALNNPRFAKQDSGLRIGTGEMSEGAQEIASMEISLKKLPDRSLFDGLFFPTKQYANAALLGVLSGRNGGAQMEPGDPQVAVGQEKWNSFDAAGKVQNTKSVNAVQAFVQAKQTGGIALPEGEKQLNLAGII
ncbi:DUF6603 domain-containing protein [Dyadobacter sp. NIV53]|uniref:DUF6603 domain-containing protein n=1 Tax=Dyadobacter sp. NIV53 TaxID=2861765 RepID=UPI001C875DF9|nr:DUF6603 domain-containing protein [Dyadobacter sp. NIV53]